MYHSKKGIDKLIKDELKSTLSTSENDSEVLAQRVVDINSSVAKILNLIDFATDAGNVDFQIIGEQGAANLDKAE